MKTPEEIKKGLECCASVNAPCKSCPFATGTGGCECIQHMCECALTYIHRLENQIGELTEMVEQFEAAQSKVKITDQIRFGNVTEIEVLTSHEM